MVAFFTCTQMTYHFQSEDTYKDLMCTETPKPQTSFFSDASVKLKLLVKKS